MAAPGQHAPAGYSAKPLAEKLGIKPNQVVLAINAPKHYTDLLGTLPQGARVLQQNKGAAEFIHYFVTSAAELHTKLILLKNMLTPNGTLWVSWPKKTAAKLHGTVTDVTEDVVRQEALAIGLVDVKVCAVDDVWSGLKLVIPVQHRH